MVPPDEFVPVAERSGLIEAIGLFVPADLDDDRGLNTRDLVDLVHQLPASSRIIHI